MEFTCGEWVRQGFGFATPNHAAGRKSSMTTEFGINNALSTTWRYYE